MRLCDGVKALTDSRPFPEFHIHRHTLESNANCFTMRRLHKHLWLFSLLHCREFIVRCQRKWRVKIKPWLHNIVFQSVFSCFGLSVRHMFRRFRVSHRLWITDMETGNNKKKQPTMLLKSNGPDLSLKMTSYEQMRLKGQKVFQGKEAAAKGRRKGPGWDEERAEISSQRRAERAARRTCTPAAALLRRHRGAVGSTVAQWLALHRICKNSSHLKSAVPGVTQITATVKRRWRMFDLGSCETGNVLQLHQEGELKLTNSLLLDGLVDKNGNFLTS